MAANFVAAGLATAHLPTSTCSYLPQNLRDNMRLYKISGMSRHIVVAMRKHLLTHGAYARIFRGIVEYCQTEFADAMANLASPPIEALTGGRNPESWHTAAE